MYYSHVSHQLQSHNCAFGQEKMHFDGKMSFYTTGKIPSE